MKKWELSFPDKKIISEIAIKCGVSTLTASVLAARGYTSPESVIESLQTEKLSDPFLICDMEAAVDIINSAVENGEEICIYGDYDCDGVMATVILYSYLSEIGADVVYYIPERSDGYGLNKNAIKSIADDGVNLIITVDNGITAIAESEYVYELGMRLIVTDHHQPGDILPKAEAVVDPHRADCLSPFKLLCGAGVALKLIAALEGGDYTVPLEQFGDLAAIATVADIVSLTGENRFLVSYGMNLIENTDRPSVAALKKVCGLEDKPIDSNSIGFGIAPRINAAGRFGSPRTAVKLFLCEDFEEAESLAEELNRLNNERKETENNIMNEINEIINSDPMIVRQRVIFLCGKNWHHGVIGIVASKILEKYGKPCFIASESNGEIRGSARSILGFSVFDALTYCAESLEKFGGHPGAGGFTVKEGKNELFNKLLQEYAAANHSIMPDYIIKPDVMLNPVEIRAENVNGLKILEPFGCDNEKPTFYIKKALVLDIISIKDGLHCKLRLKYGTASFNAFLFRTNISELKISRNDICDFIVTLDTYSFKGTEYISAVIKDYCFEPETINKNIADEKVFEAALRNESLSPSLCSRLIPSRDIAAAVYKRIPDGGISADLLYSRLNSKSVNYGQFLTAVEAMRQFKLISFFPSDNTIKRLTVKNKVDLMSSPIIFILSQNL